MILSVVVSNVSVSFARVFARQVTDDTTKSAGKVSEQFYCCMVVSVRDTVYNFQFRLIFCIEL